MRILFSVVCTVIGAHLNARAQRGRLVQRAEPRLLVEGVDLDHDPVDLVVELDPARLPRPAGLGDLLDRLQPLSERIRAEAALAEPLERLPVRRGRDALA